MAESGTHPSRVLLVEDEEDLRWLLAGCLRETGVEVVEAGSAEEARLRLRERPVQAVVSDVRMPGDSGVDLLRELRTLDSRLPVILITALEDVATAVEAMKLGAYDFLTKPFDNERLLAVVGRALETHALKQEVTRLRSRLDATRTSFGVSALAGDLDKQVELVAATPGLTVLLQGESGTGKEILARTIHARSARRDRRFVAIDCGALPEPLLESLLFGHRRGAFTGADQDREGLFREADGGTLFLDELNNLPRGLQAKLLRSLQEREVLPLGSDKPVSFDVRLIAAGNADLQEETRQGRFRVDLYHRIAEFVIRLPPLRQRPEDIAYFADMFVAQATAEVGGEALRLTTAAAERLQQHAWPGNLRELQNCLRRAALLARGATIDVGDLQIEPVSAPGIPPFQDGLPLTDQVQEAAAALERQWIREAIETAGGNKAEAARRLGIDYTTLHRKLRRYGLEAMARLP